MTRLLFSFLALILALLPGSVNAESIRKAVWAGQFYPAAAVELTKVIDGFVSEARKTPVTIPTGRPLRALILPHAGYVYSGLTAAHSALVLQEGEFNKVFVLAPDHRVGLTNAAVSDVQCYETPLGRVPLHDDAGRLRQHPDFGSNPASDQTEHAVEVILPFLQYTLKQFELVPVVLGPTDVGRITSALAPLLDEKTLLVVSSDLTHYLPYEEAKARDKETIELIGKLDSDGLSGKENSACGKGPILVLLALARRNHWQPALLHYANSGDTAGSRSQVVGYAAIAFWGEESMQEKSPSLSKEQGQTLITLARQTIMTRLGKELLPEEAKSLAAFLKDPVFGTKQGTFVTLHKAGRLRGCIGCLAGRESIVDGVRRNAINAAFQDSRFPPLTLEELEQVDIEVSVLTEPKPLSFRDAQDLLAKLRVGKDGVILSQGGASATFLPQVWQQLPRAEDFLSHLCQKAGLAPNAWRSIGLTVQTYEVQVFAELD